VKGALVGRGKERRKGGKCEMRGGEGGGNRRGRRTWVWTKENGGKEERIEKDKGGDERGRGRGRCGGRKSCGGGRERRGCVLLQPNDPDYVYVGVGVKESLETATREDGNTRLKYLRKKVRRLLTITLRGGGDVPQRNWGGS